MPYHMGPSALLNPDPTIAPTPTPDRPDYYPDQKKGPD